MIFKELLSSVDLEQVYKYISEKTEDDISTTKEYYQPVIEELKTYDAPNNPCELVFELYRDTDNELEIAVSEINRNFKCDPPKDLRAWGGKADDINDCPDGFFNINYEGYWRVFGLTGEFREDYYYATVILSDDFKKEYAFLSDSELHVLIVGEILFEITFYGQFKKDCKDTFASINDDVEEYKNSKK